MINIKKLFILLALSIGIITGCSGGSQKTQDAPSGFKTITSASGSFSITVPSSYSSTIEKGNVVMSDLSASVSISTSNTIHNDINDIPSLPLPQLFSFDSPSNSSPAPLSFNVSTKNIVLGGDIIALYSEGSSSVVSNEGGFEIGLASLSTIYNNVLYTVSYTTFQEDLSLGRKIINSFKVLTAIKDKEHQEEEAKKRLNTLLSDEDYGIQFNYPSAMTPSYNSNVSSDISFPNKSNRAVSVFVREAENSFSKLLMAFPINLTKLEITDPKLKIIASRLFPHGTAIEQKIISLNGNTALKSTFEISDFAPFSSLGYAELYIVKNDDHFYVFMSLSKTDSDRQVLLDILNTIELTNPKFSVEINVPNDYDTFAIFKDYGFNIPIPSGFTPTDNYVLSSNSQDFRFAGVTNPNDKQIVGIYTNIAVSNGIDNALYTFLEKLEISSEIEDLSRVEKITTSFSNLGVIYRMILKGEEEHPYYLIATNDNNTLKVVVTNIEGHTGIDLLLQTKQYPGTTPFNVLGPKTYEFKTVSNSRFNIGMTLRNPVVSEKRGSMFIPITNGNPIDFVHFSSEVNAEHTIEFNVSVFNAGSITSPSDNRVDALLLKMVPDNTDWKIHTYNKGQSDETRFIRFSSGREFLYSITIRHGKIYIIEGISHVDAVHFLEDGIMTLTADAGGHSQQIHIPENVFISTTHGFMFEGVEGSTPSYNIFSQLIVDDVEVDLSSEGTELDKDQFPDDTISGTSTQIFNTENELVTYFNELEERVNTFDITEDDPQTGNLVKVGEGSYTLEHLQSQVLNDDDTVHFIIGKTTIPGQDPTISGTSVVHFNNGKTTIITFNISNYANQTEMTVENYKELMKKVSFFKQKK